MRNTKPHSFSRYWKVWIELPPSTMRRRLSRRIINLPTVLPWLRHYQSWSLVVSVLICKNEVCWDFKGPAVTSRSRFGSMLQKEGLARRGHYIGTSKPAWTHTPPPSGVYVCTYRGQKSTLTIHIFLMFQTVSLTSLELSRLLLLASKP